MKIIFLTSTVTTRPHVVPGNPYRVAFLNKLARKVDTNKAGATCVTRASVVVMLRTVRKQGSLLPGTSHCRIAMPSPLHVEAEVRCPNYTA